MAARREDFAFGWYWLCLPNLCLDADLEVFLETSGQDDFEEVGMEVLEIGTALEEDDFTLDDEEIDRGVDCDGPPIERCHYYCTHHFGLTLCTYQYQCDDVMTG